MRTVQVPVRRVAAYFRHGRGVAQGVARLSDGGLVGGEHPAGQDTIGLDTFNEAVPKALDSQPVRSKA